MKFKVFDRLKNEDVTDNTDFVLDSAGRLCEIDIGNILVAVDPDRYEIRFEMDKKLKREDTVTWYSDSDGMWKCTGCDIEWFFINDFGPEGNGVKFCAGCGHQIGAYEPFQEEEIDWDEREEYRKNENDMPGGF